MVFTNPTVILQLLSRRAAEKVEKIEFHGSGQA
jgi:hypothetical protein